MRLTALFCVMAALVMGASGLALGAYGADKSANNSAILRTLLLDGKTASAIAAKKTAQEVKLLLFQQEFDHQQTQNGETRLKVVVRQVERHLDRTIQRSIARQARRFAHALKK